MDWIAYEFGERGRLAADLLTDTDGIGNLKISTLVCMGVLQLTTMPDVFYL